jgi:hypothetical protein
MEIKNYSPNLKIYKEGTLIVKLKQDPSNNNYITVNAFDDIGVIQAIQKFAPNLLEKDTKFEILYARVRGKDYQQYKDNNVV